MEFTVGMYGEIQGIAGKSVLEIEGLALLSPIHDYFLASQAI